MPGSDRQPRPPVRERQFVSQPPIKVRYFSRPLQSTAAVLSTKVAMVIAVLIAGFLILIEYWFDARHSRDPENLHLRIAPEPAPSGKPGPPLPVQTTDPRHS